MKYKNRRNNLYIGEAFYLDAESKEIIASGYGQFDTTTSELTASMTFLASGKFDKVLIIIKSRNDCIAPFVFYNKTLIQGAPENITYNIRAYLHWQSTEMDGLTIPLRKYSNAHITILAQHAPDNLGFQSHAAGMSGQLIKRAVSMKLDSSIHRGIRASIFAGYATKINSSHVRDEPPVQLDLQLRYSFTCQKYSFSFNNLGNILLAFQLYWISFFDSIDCTIDSIRLGDNVYLYLANPHLYALSTSSSSYRSIPHIQSQMHADSLAKMAYFFLKLRYNRGQFNNKTRRKCMNYYGSYRSGYYSRGLTWKGVLFYLILAGIVILMIALPTMDDVKAFFSTKKPQAETSQITTKEKKKEEEGSRLPDDYTENRTEESGIDYDTDLSSPGDINEF